jgi:hypothetical protein
MGMQSKGSVPHIKLGFPGSETWGELPGVLPFSIKTSEYERLAELPLLLNV